MRSIVLSSKVLDICNSLNRNGLIYLITIYVYACFFTQQSHTCLKVKIKTLVQLSCNCFSVFIADLNRNLLTGYCLENGNQLNQDKCCLLIVPK